MASRSRRTNHLPDRFFCYLAARFEYKQEMENWPVIAWLDNEAARYAASKGTAISVSLMAMARLVHCLEAQKPSVLWVERVCSYSNPADKPSRKQCNEAAQMFKAVHVKRKITLPEKVILAIPQTPMESFSWKGSLTPKSLQSNGLWSLTKKGGQTPKRKPHPYTQQSRQTANINNLNMSFKQHDTRTTNNTERTQTLNHRRLILAVDDAIAVNTRYTCGCRT